MNISKILWIVVGLLSIIIGVLGYIFFAEKDIVKQGTGNIVQLQTKNEDENNSGSIKPINTESKEDVAVKPVVQQTTIKYKNTEFGFSLQLPASWKGYVVSANKSQRDNSINVEITHATEKIYPPSDFLLTSTPISKTYSFIVVPVATWTKWQIGEGYPFAAPVAPFELGRNVQYVFILAPRYSYGVYVYGENVTEANKQEGETIARSFKVFNPNTETILSYPQNLSISGFKIVNGVAKATILDKCTAERTVCDYDNPIVPVTLVGKPLLTPDGYVVGMYSYDIISDGDALRHLVLVGKDGKWRYDYIDCKNIEHGCGFELYTLSPDSKNISIGLGGREQRNAVYLNAEKFLASKKSHFVLNGY